MKSYNLYFFRHGITKGNLNAQYIGHTDLPLTTDSINELHSIKAKYHYPKVDAVFSSPLKRCKDSAEIMFPDNTIITIDDFIEYNFGEFEQCTADDLKDNEDFKNWIGGDGCIKTGTQNIAIVGHAGVLMTLLSCYGLPEAPMVHWQMDPGYGFQLRITPSLWMRANKIEVIDTAPQSMHDMDKN